MTKSGDRFLFLRQLRLELERQLVAGEADRHGAAVFQRAEQDLISQPVADLGLNHARERPCPVNGIVALRREIAPRGDFGTPG